MNRLLTYDHPKTLCVIINFKKRGDFHMSYEIHTKQQNTDEFEPKVNVSFSLPITKLHHGIHRVTMDLVGDRGLWIRLYHPNKQFLEDMNHSSISVLIDRDIFHDQTFIRCCLVIERQLTLSYEAIFAFEPSDLDLIYDHFVSMNKSVILGIHASTNTIVSITEKPIQTKALHELFVAYQSSQMELTYRKNYWEWFGVFGDSFDKKNAIKLS